MQSTKRWTRLGLPVITLASVLPTAARADAPTYGGGLFVGYNVQRQSVEWGAEAFATFRSPSESSDAARVGYGPLFQVGVLGAGEDPRFTLAFHGGSELSRDLLALTGELGLSYRADSERFGVHVGLVPEMTFVNLAVRYQFLLDEAWFGLGARVMPTYGKPHFLEPDMVTWVSGRPLRSDAGRVPPGAAARAAQSGEPDALQRVLGAAWERDAQHELASIPAFIQLAHELHALRAPRSLARRALAAARDEAEHAAGCAALASGYLQCRVVPTLPAFAPRAIVADRASLIRLAVESWIDGSIVEGSAARQAARAAALTPPGAAQALLHRIAADEQRHAELGWDVLRWALTQAPEEARAALRPLSECQLSRAPEASAPPGLEPYGRVGAAELDRIAERHAAQSGEGLSALLSAS